MANLGFYFDGTRCIGCRTCQVACKDKNRIMEPGARLRKVTSYQTGKYPEARVYHMATACNHCENPACVAACATGAMYKAEDGTVILDAVLCDGCQTCVSVCPYGVPVFVEEKNAVMKCDSCKGLRDNGKNPACVDACPLRALDFGDLDALKAKYGLDLVSAVPAWADGQTGPNVLMKVKDCVKNEQFEEIII